MANGNTTLSQEDIDELLQNSQQQESQFKDQVLGMEDDLIGNIPNASEAAVQGSPSQAPSNTASPAPTIENQSIDGASLQGLIPKNVASGPNKVTSTELLQDISLRFTVVLGSTKMLVKDVVKLGEGSVVELEKYEGEEVDILVNDRLFGHGKLKVLGDYFGVQITEILTSIENFQPLA